MEKKRTHENTPNIDFKESSKEKIQRLEKLEKLFLKNKLLNHIQDIKDDLIKEFNDFINNETKENFKEISKIIHITAKNNTEKLINQLFPDQINTININILDDTNFLDKDLFDYLKDHKLELIKGLYILSVYYLIKYIKRLSKLDNIIIEKFNQHPQDLILSSQVASEIFNTKLKNINGLFEGTELHKKEKCQIMELLILITNNFSIKTNTKDKIEIINFFNQLVEGARIKTLDSVIKKLLKDIKYRKQVSKHLLVLSDQIGFKKEFLTLEETKGWANLIKQIIPEDIIIKENDRGIIKQNHSNKDTNLTKPFINFSFVEKDYPEIPLGEISLRLKDDIGDILENLKPRKDYIFSENGLQIINRESFTRLAIEKLETINHPIYKTSQDIRIVRKLLVDRGVLGFDKKGKPRVKPNFIKLFLENKFRDFFHKYLKYLRNFGILTNNINKEAIIKIKLAYYTKLLELVEKSIIDIAWEPIKYKIEALSIYRILPEKSIQRKQLKKEISILFINRLTEKKKINNLIVKKQLRKISKLLEIPKISMEDFEKDIQNLVKIYNEFFENYYGISLTKPKNKKEKKKKLRKKGILNTAIFKPVIEKIIEELKAGKLSPTDIELIKQHELKNNLK